jgi:hypothetical protein
MAEAAGRMGARSSAVAVHVARRSDVPRSDAAAV